MKHLFVWAFLLLACTRANPSSGPANPESQLLSCYNSKENSKPYEFHEFLSGQPSRLRLHSVLWSKKPSACSSTNNATACQQAVAAPLTVATATMVNRLEALQAQCLSWPGPLAATLYVPLSAEEGKDLAASAASGTLASALAKAQEVFNWSEQQGRACVLTILVAVEVVAEPLLAKLLPINAIRNLAILASSTPLVAMIDVDLLLSASLAGELVDSQERAAAMVRACAAGRLFILPAFEAPRTKQNPQLPAHVKMEDAVQVAEQTAAGPKQGLLSRVAEYQLVPFAQTYFAVGHRRTNFSLWYNSSSEYRVHWGKLFEPWFIVDRRRNPPYDVRLRGYGHNKQLQVAHAHYSNLTFMVHPGAFLVHRPHPVSEAQSLHDASYKANLEARMRAQARGRGTALGSRGTSGAGRRLGRQLASLPGQPGNLSTRVLELDKGKMHIRQVDRVFMQAMRDMEAQAYKPVVEEGHAACLAQLPWWRGQARLQRHVRRKR